MQFDYGFSNYFYNMLVKSNFRIRFFFLKCDPYLFIITEVDDDLNKVDDEFWPSVNKVIE